jgi:hypothetical protein
VNNLVTVIVGILTAGAAIGAAIIVAHAPKREIHEVVIKDDRMIGQKSLPFSQALRVTGIVTFAAAISICFIPIDLVILTWIDPSFGSPMSKFVIALHFGSAGFLFCVARWISNHLPDPPQRSG